MDITLLRSFSTTRRIKTGTWSKQQPVFASAFAPCIKACPLETDVPALVELILKGMIKEAALSIMNINPFPFITSRVCPAFCMSHCNRGEYDEAVNTKGIEGFLGNVILEEKLFPPKEGYDGERVAVIGSGPAGLTYAWFSSLKGNRVVVFEEKTEPGGLLYWGIPKHRLPKELVAEAVKRLEEIGVRFEVGRSIFPEDLEALKSEFDRVVFAGGLTEPRIPDIPGVEKALVGIRVLEEYNTKGLLPEGKDFVVIGGGNVAVDVAICLLKNRRSVTLVCVESENDMPAFREEVEEAKDLGLSIKDGTACTLIEKSNGKIKVKLAEVEVIGEEKGWKTTRIVKEGGTLTADAVIVATGQKRRFDEVDAECIGDYKLGPSTVAEAMASARRAIMASTIKRDREEIISFDSLNLFYFEKSPRVRQIGNLEDLQREASRCFSCGYCNGCGNCWTFCPDVAVLLDENGKPTLDRDHCKGCGICEEECPRAVVILKPKAT